MGLQTISEMDINGIQERIMKLRKKKQNSKDFVENIIYKCDTCKDIGMVQVDSGAWRKCKCARDTRLREFAGIPEEFKGAKLENFNVNVYQSAANKILANKIKMVMNGYITNFEEIQRNLKGKGLYLYSSEPGSGKTRAAITICNELFAAAKIEFFKFLTFPEIIDKIKEGWNKNNELTSEEIILKLINEPIMIIDDIGTGELSAKELQYAWRVINGRMTNGKITIFTANYSIENLPVLKHIDNPVEKEKLQDRLCKMALEIKFPNEKIRGQIAKQETKDLLESIFDQFF